MIKVKTVKRKSLADEIARQIQQQIEKEKIKVGEKLPTEPQLMKTFGVGRSSIREAIQKLANSGFLSVEQGRGTFVKSKSSSAQFWEERIRSGDIVELCETRDILDAALGRLAALRHDNDDLEEMEKALQERGRAAEENRLSDCIAADVTFHLAIAKATHNGILAEMYRLVAEAQQSGWQQIHDDTLKLERSQQRHEQLFEAIRSRDTMRVNKANEELLTHIWDK